MNGNIAIIASDAAMDPNQWPIIPMVCDIATTASDVP